MPALVRAARRVRLIEVVPLTVLLTILAAAVSCGTPPRELTISGSLVGREGEVLRRQLSRFREANPTIAVALRPTPDAADQRHQLYVQWLNARTSAPDVLQLDVVWTAEFAAAGWIAPLDRYAPRLADFFPAAVQAHRWRGQTYALPWFVDVGMLYWRTDLTPRAPESLAELATIAASRDPAIPFGLLWQGARYEGLVTVFLEYLGAFGGEVLDEAGVVRVDSDAAIAALTWMHDVVRDGVTPPAVLTWQEEQTRLTFQSGQSVFMRNWPYAYSLLADQSQSRVAGRFAVAAMPAGPNGRSTATLGGSALAINAHSDQPDEAFRLIDYLLEPAQMIERAAIAGELPPRPALYDSPALATALQMPVAEIRRVIERAVARPATPLYSELSEILQVALHRALTDQVEPAAALTQAAQDMRRLLTRYGLASS